MLDPGEPGPGPLTCVGLWLAAWRGFLQLGRSVITPRPRLFSTAASVRGLKVPLADFKALKQRYGSTIDDDVLPVIAEGLHRWLTGRGARVPERIGVFVPVSMRTPGVKADPG